MEILQMNQQEEWRPIDGFPDYRVSSEGRVISYRVWRGRPGPRELRRRASGHYRSVFLASPDGMVRKRYVHHLVAEAFHGPRPEGMEIRHLDGDRLNNAATNLQYGTPSENQQDTLRHGTHAWAGKPECRNGHPYTPETTRYWPSQSGCRTCITCKRASDARVAARRAAKAAA